MTLAAALDRATAPLDAVRRLTFSVTLADPRTRWFILPRDRRVAVIATTHAIIAFGLAVFVPTALLVVGPILLGVPHVAADVRYLVLRRGLPRWWLVTIGIFCASLVALRTVAECHLVPASLDRVEFSIVAAWLALALIAGCAESRARIRAVSGALALVAITALTLRDPATARLVFAQGHNIVALVLWAALFRRRRAALAVPIVTVTAGAVLLGSGALYETTLHHADLRAFGLHLFQAADWIAPRVRADYGVGLTCAYAFLQSVHYAVWLHLVPQDDTRGAGLRSFRSSARSLFADFGASGVATTAAAALVVLAASFIDAARTRGVYLSLAMFHGYLELALLAYFWGRGFEASRARQ